MVWWLDLNGFKLFMPTDGDDDNPDDHHHEDDDGAHDDHHDDQEGRCAMLGTEGGPLLRETEMSRDVGEGSSVKPWGSGSAKDIVTV